MGWAGACPKRKRIRGEPWPLVVLSGSLFLPTTLRAQAPAQTTETVTMRFYQQQHQFYAGIDLHARTLYLCVLDQAGSVVRSVNLKADPATLLTALAP